MNPELQSYRGKRVFLTGGSGYIGSNLQKKLKELGADVFAPTRAELDIRDSQSCLTSLDKARPDIVFHLAADLRGRGNIDNLEDIFLSNTAGTVFVLEACRRAEVGNVVTIASADEIGGGVNLYGVSKATASAWAQGFCRFSELSVVVARLYLVYGPGQRGELFLPSLLESIAQSTKLAMTRGNQTRDFTWIDDVIHGLLLLGLEQELKGQIVEICTGIETSLRELVNLVELLSGHESSVNFGELPYRKGEPFQLVGDPKPMEELTGFRPQTTLRQGLTRLLS